MDAMNDLTKLEYFTAAALSGVVVQESLEKDRSELRSKRIASRAVKVARAVLKELEKPEEQQECTTEEV